jgi:hypothetical protein
MAEGNMIRLTGLWKNKTKAGEGYLAGAISPTSRLLILPNTKKTSPKEPDYTAFIVPNVKKEGGQEASRGEDNWP